ncbi:unnamed protein product [Phytophthora lilii]|uniref:Unnamed protein product n=1 Tax=Phytophthora lilii TaxID=2077276 RepID=A0A9W6XRL3_9STRA|nr:unnamed protein product [Phytophthora lilii]
MEVQGITKGKTATSRRASVTITLGWERVYVFDVWIMDHNAGVDVVLGTDFMIPAGVRLDLFDATAKLPDEVMVPLIKTQNMIDDTEGSHVVGGPTERPARVRLTNLTDKLVSCPVHLPVVVWVPAGLLPRDVGYVRLDSAKYREWQVLAYEAVRDKTLFRWEGELYDQWLARQPSAVEKPAYTTGFLQRPTDDSEDEMSSADDWGNDIDESVAATGDAKTSGEHTNRTEPEDIGGDNSQTTGIECKVSPLQILENTFISVIRVLTTESNEANNSSADNSFEHLGAEIGLEDYAHELAFLPDLTETSATDLDFSAPNVQNAELTTDQQERLVGMSRGMSRLSNGLDAYRCDILKSSTNC